MDRHPDANVIPLRNRQEAQPRLPPHNYEAEQALLGALLASNRAPTNRNPQRGDTNCTSL